MRDGARQCRVVIGVGLRARAGEIEMELIGFFYHRAVKLLGDRLASFAIEGERPPRGRLERWARARQKYTAKRRTTKKP